MGERGRISFAWQLGANYGHLMTDVPVAECLRRRGYDVSFTVADMRIATEVLAPLGFSFTAAPLWSSPTAPPQSPPPPASYAEIMQSSGFGDDRVLDQMLDAWMVLVRTHADVLVADHAPMALLAAYLLGIPAVLMGNGFTIPPLMSPFPGIRPWEEVQANRLLMAEHNVLQRINATIGRHGKQPLQRLADLFASGKILLTTIPELDPYADRRSGAYVGFISASSNGTPVRWQSASRPRIFAYLRPSMPRIAAILTALEESGAQVIVAMPGAGADLQRHFASTQVTLLGGAVPLAELLSGADLVVSYGGAGTIASSLLAGVPMLLVPQNAEQYLNSVLAAKLDAGILIDIRQEDSDVAPALARLLREPSYRLAARALAEKYRAFDPDAAAESAADMILECMPRSKI
jgi:UDP:flavonoid glycosyltransferase YjiC (YdhE family)